jgi:hypothetical protein
LDDDSSNSPNIDFELLPIDEFVVPESFTFGQKDTIKLKYTLNSGCYFFDGIHKETQEDGSIILGIRAVIDLNANCTRTTFQDTYNYIITIDQIDDYIFKFYKGISLSTSTFEQVIVPVN